MATTNLDALTLSGALSVTGAQTFTGAATFTGAIAVNDTTAATSTTTGSIQTDGGLGVAGAAFFGDTLTFGVLASDDQTGIALSAAQNEIIEVYADDNDTTLTNAVYSTIRSRTMLFKTATGISLFGVRGQIKCADEVDFGPGVFAPVQGYFETMDDTDIKSGAKFWGVDSSIESPSGGTVTVNSGGILGGLHAELTGAGEFVQDSGGILAGLYIDEQVTTGQWGYGVYIAAGAAASSIYVAHTAAATNGRAMRIATTQAVPAMADGYGVIEKDLTVTGTATGMINAESSWINLGTSAVVPGYCHVHNDGIWDGTATLTNAYVSWQKFHMMLQSNPSWCSLYELNFDGAHSEIDVMYNCNNPALALGYQAGTPTKAAVGSIPFCGTAGGTIRYIYLYDAADSD